MTTAPRCSECDTPLIVIDLYWLCPNWLCPRYGKFIRSAVDDDPRPTSSPIRSEEAHRA